MYYKHLDYKSRRKILNHEHYEDSIDFNKCIYDTSNIINDCVSYFKEDTKEIIFPAKSFCVAIIYADMIYRYFGNSFYDVLDDPDLLLDQDRYFIRYSQMKELYDEILKAINYPRYEFKGINARKTLKYFYEEFDVDVIFNV